MKGKCWWMKGQGGGRFSEENALHPTSQPRFWLHAMHDGTVDKEKCERPASETPQLSIRRPKYFSYFVGFKFVMKMWICDLKEVQV